MENPVSQKQITQQSTAISTLPQTVQELSTSLNCIKPDNSEITQLITYALVATAIVGIFVYQYIKSQEA
jgi:hypothetical protein